MQLLYTIELTGWIIASLIICDAPINGQTLTKQNSLCPLNKRMCQNGECIDEDEFCDGMKDCRDGSDETAEACVQVRCPEYAFRCTYGGCVVGNAQCNNKTECADGSDELQSLCDPSYMDKIVNNCLDKFECQSGECISEENVCDGIVNCKDGTDETVTVCGGKTCPTFAFVCGYGACVSGKAQCNGIDDCADKSDEFETLCGQKEPESPYQPTLAPLLPPITRPPIVRTQPTTQRTQSPYEINRFPQTSFSPQPFPIIRPPPPPRTQPPSPPPPPTPRRPPFRTQPPPSTQTPPRITQTVPRPPPTTTRTSTQLRTRPLTTPSHAYTQPITSTTIRPGAGFSQQHGGFGGSSFGGSSFAGHNSFSESEFSVHSSPDDDCQVGYLPYEIIVYESFSNTEIEIWQWVKDYTNIEYKCKSQLTLIGHQSNICLQGHWLNDHPTCEEVCSLEAITGVTTIAACEYEGTAISCDQPLRPGTRVNISCQVGYKQQTSSYIPDVIVCDENGQWNYFHLQCVQDCGHEEMPIIPITIGDQVKNHTVVPWYASIYSRQSGEYHHMCGGTIINAKVIISAAECFWDVMNDEPYDKSLFTVAVGKIYRDFLNRKEPLLPEIFQISELYIHRENGHKNSYHQSGVAILVLDNIIIFKQFIKPICIDLNFMTQEKKMKSGILGKTANWQTGNRFGETSLPMQVLDTKSISGDDCVLNTGTQMAGDKFCAAHENIEKVCSGNNGAGFAVPKMKNGVRQFYLQGVLSNGLTSVEICIEKKYTTFTNINYHIDLITEYENKYKPN